VLVLSLTAFDPKRTLDGSMFAALRRSYRAFFWLYDNDRLSLDRYVWEIQNVAL
jgi:hypothetical protein